MRESRRGLPGAWRDRSESQWRSSLEIPDLELYESLPSTNARLLTRASAGAEPFTTVVASAQTQGRGRGGRRWDSPAEAGLWQSVLLDSGPRGEVGVLPLAVGVAAALALERFLPGRVALKWPNDLLLDERKVGGILCETVRGPGRGVVVGIGVNLRRPPGGPPEELEPGVAFLEEEGGRPVPEPVLARAFIDELRRCAQPAPVQFSRFLRDEWERRDCLRGREVRVDTGATGTVAGVAADGSLELTGRDGRALSIRAGSVRLVQPGRSPALHRAGGTAAEAREPVVERQREE